MYKDLSMYHGRIDLLENEQVWYAKLRKGNQINLDKQEVRFL